QIVRLAMLRPLPQRLLRGGRGIFQPAERLQGRSAEIPYLTVAGIRLQDLSVELLSAPVVSGLMRATSGFQASGSRSCRLRLLNVCVVRAFAGGGFRRHRYMGSRQAS